MRASRYVLLSLVMELGLVVGCVGDNTDEQGTTDAGGSADSGDTSTDPAEDQATDPASGVEVDLPGDFVPDAVVDQPVDQQEDAGPQIDDLLVGVWSFQQASALGIDFLPEWFPRPTPTNPFLEMRVAAAYAMRDDGSWSIMQKHIFRESPEAEVFIYPEVDGLAEGEWWIDDAVLVHTWEPDTRELEWEYEYDETTELLTLDATGGAMSRPDQLVWRRESLDPALVESWSLESLRLDDGLLLTTENQTVVISEDPPDSFEARVSGSLDLNEDGTYDREVIVWIDDEVDETEAYEGVWYVRDGILRYEEAVIDIISWTYSVDLEAGRFTQSPYETWDPDFSEVVWTRDQQP